MHEQSSSHASRPTVAERYKASILDRGCGDQEIGSSNLGLSSYFSASTRRFGSTPV